jgi:hypothetical protein
MSAPARALQFARDLAEPDWSLSVPVPAKRTISKLLAAVEGTLALHKPIKVYDECECPDGTHPDEYEYIDCEDYAGCENTFSHEACETCCTEGDYISEWCSDHHDHKGHRCPTVEAIEKALEANP